MKRDSQKFIKKKSNNLKGSIYATYERSINIRRKTLSKLDSKLKFSFRNIHALLGKINNVKDLVCFNKYDTRDLKSLKNLDNNALLFSKNMKEEIKKTSELLYAYNLSPNDLDNFMLEYEEELRNRNKKEEIEKFYNLKREYINLKKEFDLITLGKNKNDNIDDSFLDNERKLRDLYNLKLELFLGEEKKKIGENKYFEIVKKAPKCIIDKDKRINPKYDIIKSKINEEYKLSKSYEIEEANIEKTILNEMPNEEENNEIKNKNKIIREQNNYFNYYYNNKNNNKPNNKYIEETIKERNKSTKNLLIFKKKVSKNENNINRINNIKNIQKRISTPIYKNKSINYGSLTYNNNSQGSINKIKKIKRNRVNSAHNIQRNNYYMTKPIFQKLFQSNFTDKNYIKRPISPQATKTKPTFYSTTTSSRAISAFSTKNNNTINNLKNNKIIYINSSLINKNISKYKKKSNFRKYIDKINKIINYSNYTTNNFKKSSYRLKNKKLFQKSNNEIFERQTFIDIEKIKEGLKLDKNRHTTIDDKKLIYNNSKKVKLMLNEKNRKVLNTILMELLDKQRRVNNYYTDLSHYEKLMLKFASRKKMEKLTNEMMNYEKRFDKEKVLEIFKLDEEQIMEYMKEISNKDKYDEEEWKHILLKHKNMRLIYSANVNKMVINGNLHKKHLVSKFKKEKY